MPRGKKTTTTVIEEADDAPEVKEPSYDDIHKKEMEQLITEPEVTEEKKEEGKEPEKPVVEEEKGEEVEFDPEQFKKDTAKEVSDSIINALQGKDKAQTDDNLNQYQKFAKDVWEKEGRNPTWDEVLPLIEEAAVQRLESKQQEAIQADQEAKAKTEETQKAELEKFNGELTEGLNDLYRSGQLPKIKTPYPDESLDRNSDEWKTQEAQYKADPAFKEREALYQTMADVNTKRVAEGLAPIRDIVRIHAIYHKPSNRQPAGADAAIISGRASTASVNDDENYSYKDIHNGGNKSFLKTFFRR